MAGLSVYHSPRAYNDFSEDQSYQKPLDESTFFLAEESMFSLFSRRDLTRMDLFSTIGKVVHQAGHLAIKEIVP